MKESGDLRKYPAISCQFFGKERARNLPPSATAAASGASTVGLRGLYGKKCSLPVPAHWSDCARPCTCVSVRKRREEGI